MQTPVCGLCTGLCTSCLAIRLRLNFDLHSFHIDLGPSGIGMVIMRADRSKAAQEILENCSPYLIITLTTTQGQAMPWWSTTVRCHLERRAQLLAQPRRRSTVRSLPASTKSRPPPLCFPPTLPRLQVWILSKSMLACKLRDRQRPSEDYDFRHHRIPEKQRASLHMPLPSSPPSPPMCTVSTRRGRNLTSTLLQPAPSN